MLYSNACLLYTCTIATAINKLLSFLISRYMHRWTFISWELKPSQWKGVFASLYCQICFCCTYLHIQSSLFSFFLSISSFICLWTFFVYGISHNMEGAFATPIIIIFFSISIFFFFSFTLSFCHSFYLFLCYSLSFICSFILHIHPFGPLAVMFFFICVSYHRWKLFFSSTILLNYYWVSTLLYFFVSVFLSFCELWNTNECHLTLSCCTYTVRIEGKDARL